MMREFLEKYQIALSIAEHERACLRRAVGTEQDKRARSKSLASKAFKDLYGDITIWDDEKMQLLKVFEAGRQMAIEEQEIIKHQERERKAREKEERDILNQQRKQLNIEVRL